MPIKNTQILIAIVTWLAWTFGMVTMDHWHLFGDNWFMSVTMLAASFIAGATSEGGGAVAFPVMTLGFGILPATARDFALMIQSVGMTAASIFIFRSGIPVVTACLLPVSVGGAVGIICGLTWVAPNISPPFAKMLFTSLWVAFALVLIIVNRRTHKNNIVESLNLDSIWHIGSLLAVGMVGGVITSITGSGIDIVTFSVLVLFFRVSEKIATPTSVALMAMNAVVGSLWQGTLGTGLAAEAWHYWWVSVPVVVVGAPFGAWYIRNRSRTFITRLLIGSIFFQFCAALVIIPQTGTLLAFSGAILLVGITIFLKLNQAGLKRSMGK